MAREAVDAAGLWRRVIELAGSQQLRALLGHAELQRLEDGVARLRVHGGVAPMIEAKSAAIESLLAQAAGCAVKIAVEPAAAESTPGGGEPGESPAASGGAGLEAGASEDHPLVRRAAELFGAKVVHVQPLAKRP